MTRKGNRRQSQIYDYIRDFHAKHHYAPTVREIANAMRMSSTSMVVYYLAALRDKGLLDWQPGLSRTIVVKEDQ